MLVNSDVQLVWLIRKQCEKCKRKEKVFLNNNVHVIRSRLIETVYKYLSDSG